MKVSVVFNGQRKLFEGEARSIEDILRALKINLETVIVKRGKEVAPPEDAVNDGEEIELIKIFSGG